MALTAQIGYTEISNGLPRSGSGVADAIIADTAVAAVASAGSVVGTPEAVRTAVERYASIEDRTLDPRPPTGAQRGVLRVSISAYDQLDGSWID